MDIKEGSKVRHKDYINPDIHKTFPDKTQPFNNYGVNTRIKPGMIYTVSYVGSESLYIKELGSWTFHKDEFVLVDYEKSSSFFD